MPSREESRAFLAGKWLLAATVPSSALAIGSLHTPVLVVVALAAALACALLWSRLPRRTSRGVRWVLVAFAILLGITVFQSIPLPAGVVSVIAPGNADAWSRALSPLRESGPAWHPLTVAPPATHVEIVRGLLYGCAFLGALRIAFEDGGSAFLERIVVASAVLMALTTLAHASIHAERVFGIYRPREAYGYYAGRLSPLLNPNHLSAYLNVGAFVAGGVALGRGHAMPRALAIGGILLLAATSVWAGSRGGTGTLVLGGVLAGVLALRRKGRMSIRGSEAALVLVAIVAAGVLLGLGSSEIARGEVVDRDVTKVHLAMTTLRLVPLSPFVGVGRGAFETMFPIVRDGGSYFTFLRTENIATQWPVEWGVPAALAAAVALAIAFRPAVVLGAARPPVGAWVAIVATVVHELVDFHLEIPGVVVLVAVAAAIVIGARAPSQSSQHRKGDLDTARNAQRTAWLASTATLLAVIPATMNASHSLREDRDRIAALATDASVTKEAFRDEIRAAMLRYPAEPFLPLAGAIRAQAMGEGSVVPWTARALERYPGFGRAHLVLARSFAARHRAQARLEYRLAYEHDPDLRERVLKEAPRLVDDHDDAMELVAAGEGGVVVLDELAATLAARLPASAAMLDAELERRSPGALGAARRRVTAMLSDVTNAHPWCEGSRRCQDDAVAAARAIVARDPDHCEPHVKLARVRIAVGEPKAGLDELEAAGEKTVDRDVCLRGIVELSLEIGDKKRVEVAAERALRGGCGGPSACVDLYTWLAGIEEARGNRIRAMNMYKRAYELAPEKEYLLERYAQTASEAGLLTEAIEAYGKLTLRHPDDPRWAGQREALRAKQHERALSPR